MTNDQIVTLYEKGGLSVEDIAAGFELEVDAVKIALLSGSGKFRKEVKNNPETFTEDVFNNAVNVMSELLYASENEGVRYRAAKFIINEKKGRHDLKNLQEGGTINVNLINIQMTRAKEALKLAKEKIIKKEAEPELIEV